MRCPKCGYISFDHLAECLKCNKNITEISSNLYGSTYNIEAPAFLHLDKMQKEKTPERMDLSGESFATGDDEYVDEELEILVEEEPDIEVGIGFVEDEHVDLELSGDKEADAEIEIDFSQFEAAEELKADLFDTDEVEEKEQQEQVAQPSLAIEMPDELSDISDLAAPPEKSIEEDVPSPGKQIDSDFADLDLDDLNFDLDLGVVDKEPASKPEVPEEAVLTLDEIDFTETLAESNSETSKKSEAMDMDLDLDFDLDLGELSIQN